MTRTGWAIDAITSADVTYGLELRFSNGWHSRYPPLHFYLLSGLFAPVVLLHLLGLVDVRSPPATNLFLAMGTIVSLVMAVGTTAVVYLIVSEVIDFARRSIAPAVAALAVALSPQFIFYSKTTNLEVPYLFWFALSLLLLIRVLKYVEPREALHRPLGPADLKGER